MRSPWSRYRSLTRTTSEAEVSLTALVNAGRVSLPDHPTLLRDLRDLERRRGRSGKDSVDHPRGLMDDTSNVVSGLVSLLLGRNPGLTWSAICNNGGLLLRRERPQAGATLSRGTTAAGTPLRVTIPRGQI